MLSQAVLLVYVRSKSAMVNNTLKSPQAIKYITIPMKRNVSEASSSSTTKNNFSLYQVSIQTYTLCNTSSF